MKNQVKALALCSSLIASNVVADVNINGFANIVAGKTSSDDMLWGHDDSINFKEDSLFALQATSDLSEGLTATVQVLARGREDWDTEFEWAYLAYDINDNFRVLAGRQRTPYYMFSDFLDVSYAYPWITPPAGLYAVPADTFDGISGIYSFTVGEFDGSAQMIFGSNTDDAEIFGQVVDAKFEDLFGGSLTFTRDWLTLRAAYFTADTSLPSDDLLELANNWRTASFNVVGDNILISEDNSTFIEFGFQIDYNNLLLIGEYTELEVDDSPLADNKSMYLTAGYRFDDVLVHFTYGYDESEIKNLVDGVPSGVDTSVDQLIATTSLITDFQQQDATYYTLGLRWDFHDSAAFKVEYTDFSDDDNAGLDAGLIRTALVTVF